MCSSNTTRYITDLSDPSHTVSLPYLSHQVDSCSSRLSRSFVFHISRKQHGPKIDVVPVRVASSSSSSSKSKIHFLDYDRLIVRWHTFTPILLDFKHLFFLFLFLPWEGVHLIFFFVSRRPCEVWSIWDHYHRWSSRTYWRRRQRRWWWYDPLRHGM